ATNVLRFLQPDVFPRLATIVRTVHAVAIADAALAVVLARADPDDVGVLGVEHDCTDRVGTLIVEDRRPGRAAVDRFPHAARSRRHEVMTAIARIDRELHDTA